MDYVKLSKTLSHMLRHAPEHYGITVDAHGWTPIDNLLATLRRKNSRWRSLTADDIRQMMQQSKKQRFELKNGYIRARYGHTLPGRLSKQPAEPPLILYHGTTAKAAAIILEQGLRPMRRQYVHLSADQQTALEVGGRRTPQPVLLQINAQVAWHSGVYFYREGDGIWLSEPIAPEFISKTGDN